MTPPARTVAAILFVVTLSVNLQVPLYPAYARTAGVGVGLTAFVFATYVAGLLPVLVAFGGISDRLGRRPVLIASLVCAGAATALVMVSPSMRTLLAARALQGVGVGLAVGTGTAFLAELLVRPHGSDALNDGATRAAAITAATTSVGFGGGALATSIALWVRPSGDPMSYAIVLAAVAVLLVAAFRLPAVEPVGNELVRRPALPAGAVVPGLAVALAWAVTGLVIVVVPAELAVQRLAVWSGPALFLVNGAGALVQPIARRMSPARALQVGFGLLPLGSVMLVLGTALGSVPILLAGAAVAGAACYGFTYLGGLAIVASAGAADRARAVSGYFVFGYIGFGLPSLVVGAAADRWGAVPALAGAAVGVAVGCAGLAIAHRASERAVGVDDE